jgi:hypothetical protein
VIGRPAVGEVAPGVYRFRPPIRRVARSLVAVPVSAAAFLIVAWNMMNVGPGANRLPWSAAVPLVLVGVLVSTGAVIAARRRARRTVFEVAPEGIWSPGSGRLPWPAIAEVRLELMRGLSDGEVVGTAGYLRVGVVPRDVPLPALQRSMRVMTALQNESNGLIQRLVPAAQMGPPDRAPFGVADDEVRESLADVVAAVRRYVPVVDAGERWARARAALDPGAAPGAAVPPVPPAHPDARPPRAIFLRPVLDLAITQTALAPGAFILGGIIVAWLMPPRRAAGAPPWAGEVFVAVGAIAIVMGLWMLRPLVVQVRRSFEPLESLAVSPDGIWTQELHRLVPWPDVAQVRAEPAGLARIWRGKAEAWRIVVEPVATFGGGVAGVRSDEIDAPFGDVLELIRYYHSVVETR